MGLVSRIKNAWNAFTNNNDQVLFGSKYVDLGNSSTFRPDRMQFSRGNERSIVTAIYNRIGIDCSEIDIRHVRLDDNKRFIEEIDSPLNNCLSLEANLDQTARAFVQDIVQSLFDEGCVAVVPVLTDDNPNINNAFDIYSMRVGRITQWYPHNIQVELYNEDIGTNQQIIISKGAAAIIENPFYSIMNEKNSTMQRLIRKLNLLDAIDEQSGSGKLDLIIQLPYVVKTEARKKQAEERRKDIESQLASSKFGIAYTDGTEHITQLNRPVDNNLMKQIEFLTSMLYSQLGVTNEILNGTANDETMLNYTKRTIEPIMSAIVDEMKRKFLTKTARSQNQSIVYFNDPFRLVPVNKIAEIADKFTRNEIMSSNEIRQIVGLKPVNNPKADELRNKNLNIGNDQEFASVEENSQEGGEENQNGEENV